MVVEASILGRDWSGGGGQLSKPLCCCFPRRAHEWNRQARGARGWGWGASTTVCGVVPCPTLRGLNAKEVRRFGTPVTVLPCLPPRERFGLLRLFQVGPLRQAHGENGVLSRLGEPVLLPELNGAVRPGSLHQSWSEASGHLSEILEEMPGWLHCSRVARRTALLWVPARGVLSQSEG